MVMAGNQPLFTPAAVAQVAANVANQKEAAKVAGVMRQLGGGSYSPSREMVLEMS